MTLALERDVRPALPDYGRLRSEAAVWRRTGRDGTEWQHQHEAYLRYLDALTDDREPVPGAPARDELLAGAVVYFSELAPTWDEHQAMLDISAVTGANVYDLALAWSIGWSPAGEPRAEGAVRPTENALYALIEQTAASVAVSSRMLAETTGLAVVERDDHGSLAAIFGMSITGRCDCGHHVRGCTGCGRGCCFADHDLRTWDPYRCHLRAFVDQAVRGTAQRRILGGAFAGGMLFRALEREGRLLCRTVEWSRCDVCGRAFEGSSCPEPHPRRAGSVRREPRKNQLIQPAGDERGHLPLQRWLCTACHHLFGVAGAHDAEAARCPRCARRSSRRMTVWTRVPPSRSVVA